MSFQHDVAGGSGNLVVSSLKSPNFVHGVQGWSVNKDGSAEFHSIILPDGQGVSVFIQGTAPVTSHVGDLWYDTANGLELSQWNGSSWVPFQISSGAIAPGGVSASNIASLTASLVGNLGVLNANPYFTGGDGTGWVAQNGTFSVVSGSSLPAGAPFVFAGLLTANATTPNVLINNGAFQAVPGSQYLITAWVYSSFATISVGFNWQLGGSFVSTSSTTLTVTANTWTPVSFVATAPASGINRGLPIFATSGGNGATLYVQAAIALPEVPGGLIQAGTVTAAQIAAGAVTAAQIAANTITTNQIAANTIVGGDIAAATISGVNTGATFSGLNMIPDPQFTNAGISSARLNDPQTTSTWTLGSGVASVTPGTGNATLVLMPSMNPSLWVNPGEQYYLQVTVTTTGARTVDLSLHTNAVTGGTVSISGTVTGTQTISGVVTVPAGASAAYVNLFVASGTAATVTFSNPVCQPATLNAPSINGGTLMGASIVADGSNGDVLVYSGIPASGNLAGSWSAAAGSDGLGNSFPIGLVVGPVSQPQVHLIPGSSSQSEISFPLPGTWTHLPSIYAQLANPGAFLSVNGPTDTTVNDQAFMSLSSAASTGVGASVGELNYIDANGVLHIIAGWSKDGLDIRAGNIAALEPGTGTSPTNPAVGETWHAITLDSGWTAASGFDAPQYRLLPTGDLQLRGAASRTAFTSNTALNNSNPLPAAYQPVNTHHYRGYDASTGTARCGVQIGPTGIITGLATASTSAGFCEIDGIIPLG